MTIDEAIKHCEEVAKEKDEQAWEAQLQEEYGMIKSCKECAEEHRQLAEWLKDYKRLLEKKNALDEEQEQLDFVQPHKKIPVTLTVQKEKTCDGCLFQQYPRITICQECSRYYSDNYVKE